MTKKYKKLIFIAAGLMIIFLAIMSGCATPTVAPTPTPTRTATPTPTLTPSPTPTPAFPVTIGCEPGVPSEACSALQSRAEEDTAHFAWTDEPGAADVRLSLDVPDPSAQPVGTWVYALAAPFFTTEFEASLAEVQQAWQGSPSADWGERPLLMTVDTAQTWAARWGDPAGTVRVVAASSILTEAQASDGWALLPFHELTPRWKVLRVDGLSPVEKDPRLEKYPLQTPCYISSATRPETLAMLALDTRAFDNRREDAMTIIAMTGVTAMSRGTASLMERAGVTYPARDILPWFEGADFVHVSNEVSFTPTCTPAPSGSLVFCSHDRYIELLEAIGANVVELTGNHLGDVGREWIHHTLEMYAEREWGWYGGGADIADATRPLTLTHNGNHIAFLGCNPSGTAFFASETLPGAAPCFQADEHALMQGQVSALRDAGYLPIVTLQHREVDQYEPWPGHIRDLRAYAEAGAVIVHGSQAHWVKPMEFHAGAFIHYGPGNLFFDQMWANGVRQGFLTRYTVHAGQLLSIEMQPYIIEEYGRPRPMTDDDPNPAANRKQFLEMIFELRP